LEEDEMENLMTAVSVTAGMVFSLAVAILVEELIFGKVILPIFARQLIQAGSGRKR
jgi:membrane protease YdiL (CAAX protease family)